MSGLVLRSDFLPGLQELCQVAVDPKTALAVMRNYQECVKVISAIEAKRMELIKEYAKKDEDGGVLTVEEDGQTMADIDEEGKTLFEGAMREYLSQHLHEMNIETVKTSDIVSGGYKVRPGALIMVQPMLIDDEVKDTEGAAVLQDNAG